MPKEEMMDAVVKFLKAQGESEKKCEENFTCPLCGGIAWWGRASINGHLHAGCEGCDFRIIQ